MHYIHCVDSRPSGDEGEGDVSVAACTCCVQGRVLCNLAEKQNSDNVYPPIGHKDNRMHTSNDDS